jgi:hypothetical protein
VNEELWLSATRSRTLLDHLHNAGDRKVRLLAVAAVRVFGGPLSSQESSSLLVAERHADGDATASELIAAHVAVESHGWDRGRLWDVTRPRGLGSPLGACYTLGKSSSARAAVCDLIRDIFGNPFRPVAFDPSWRSDNAVSLSRVMYETRDFAAMPILADALQDAGCEHADILDHCRGDGVHVRGCWVADLVLGRE